MTVPDEEVYFVTRCDSCSQLTQDKDMTTVEDTIGELVEVCGWCAADLEKKKLAQNVIHPDDRALF